MSVHTAHPNTHDNGLADDCPRCAEHAEHPFESLDDDNLRALIERTQAWMRDEAFPRSENERRATSAARVALIQAEIFERIASVRV